VDRDILFEEVTVGSAVFRNRLIRAGTSESMADPESGTMTGALLDLYERLAANLLGGIITGHLYVHPRGKYARGQTGIHDLAVLAGLAELTERVHGHDGVIFAQLAHAGSQTRVPGNSPLAPSPVPNPLTGAEVGEATSEEIGEAVDAFATAAKRAVQSGFDGVHIHGANGYLISEFGSPLTNRRTDEWGGSAEARDRFACDIVKAVRAAVPAGFPVTMKVGFVDALPGGLGLDESIRRAEMLVGAGLDAIEVSCGLMSAPTDSAMTYVAVGPKRAAQDLLIHRLAAPPRPEAYFRPWARVLRAQMLRAQLDTKVILVGGIRTTNTMRDLVVSGDADLVAMARPLIREPDLIAQIQAGREGQVDCTSCNLCLIHEGHHPLQCWRTPRIRLLKHAVYRLSGGFKKADVVPTRH
jgi:2,4-dienoyl-CoA reductase-like NADH-dependent reductase (Old Yellow Enzyme family)